MISAVAVCDDKLPLWGINAGVIFSPFIPNPPGFLFSGNHIGKSPKPAYAIIRKNARRKA
jgi:hypothetical protein